MDITTSNTNGGSNPTTTTTSINETSTSTTVVPKSELKFRENFYRMVISQLFYDGYQHAAVNLSGAIQANPPCPPSNRLYNLIKAATSKQDSNVGTNGNNGGSSSVDETKAVDDVLAGGTKRLAEFDQETQSGRLDFKFVETIWDMLGK